MDQLEQCLDSSGRYSTLCNTGGMELVSVPPGGVWAAHVCITSLGTLLGGKPNLPRGFKIVDICSRQTEASVEAGLTC